jgi:hypothetical protein
MGEQVRIKITGTSKGMYLDKHRDLINKAVGKVILADEWDKNHWCATMEVRESDGTRTKSPIPISKDDCIKL